MPEFSITSPDFEEGGEIPKKFGYKHGNETPRIELHNVSENVRTVALIMDDPDAMAAVGKVWVHWLVL
ncbi:MAG: phospholipid-binding protein, partial [Thaumarchaeota archaeon]|nr:phospholipid-binding protein [Nitrososphaerota archaeon]